jgi:hypothetical protein
MINGFGMSCMILQYLSWMSLSSFEVSLRMFWQWEHGTRQHCLDKNSLRRILCEVGLWNAVWGGFSSFAKIVWKVWAPSKCKFFMCLLLQNRVWTANRLLNREWTNSYFCHLCYRNLKTTNHLLVEYPISCSIWHAVGAEGLLWSQNLEEQSWFCGLVCWSRWKLSGHDDKGISFTSNLGNLKDLVWAEQQDLQ